MVRICQGPVCVKTAADEKPPQPRSFCALLRRKSFAQHIVQTPNRPLNRGRSGSAFTFDCVDLSSRSGIEANPKNSRAYWLMRCDCRIRPVDGLHNYLPRSTPHRLTRPRTAQSCTNPQFWDWPGPSAPIES